MTPTGEPTTSTGGRATLPLAGCSFGWLHLAPLPDALRALARQGFRSLELTTAPPHLSADAIGPYERLELARLLAALQLRAVLDQGLARLVARAEALGITIGLENSPYGYLGRSGDLVEIVDRWSSPRLRITYDVANALAIEDPAEGVRRAGDRLVPRTPPTRGGASGRTPRPAAAKSTSPGSRGPSRGSASAAPRSTNWSTGMTRNPGCRPTSRRSRPRDGPRDAAGRRGHGRGMGPVTPPPMPSSADVVVAGSGTAGLTAALAAAVAGAEVLLVERGQRLGGTTALSGGRVWVPCNHLQDTDSPEAAAAYLDGLFSDRYRHMTEAFLATAPEMARFVERHSAHRFAACPRYPDYHSSRPGAMTGGRALDAQPIDTRDLTPLAEDILVRPATCRCPSPSGRTGATRTGSTGNCCASASATASSPAGWRWSPGCSTAWCRRERRC